MNGFKAFTTSFLALSALCSCASMGSNVKCTTEKITLTPSADFTVESTRYRGKSDTFKTLILMPPTGGTNYIDRRYAEKFCQAGYDVLIVEKWSGIDEDATDLELHQRLYARSQRAITAVISEIKTPFIGMLGTSVGGTYAAVSAHLQPRLNAVFVIVAGITIPEIIVSSDQKEMRNLKLARMARYRFMDDAEYLRTLSRNFTLDPSQLGDGHKNKDLGVIIATQDETVPTATQNKLADLWQPRVRLIYDSSHFWGIVKSWWFSDERILEFFEDSFRRHSSTKATP